MLSILALPFLGHSQTLILGAQAGPMYAPRWENAAGLAVVIGAAAGNYEVTGQIGGVGENPFQPVHHGDGFEKGIAYALIMFRYGTPVSRGITASAGAGIGTGRVNYGNSEGRELILPVVELGLRRVFLKVLQAGVALESQELQRNHLVIRVNLHLGPFDRP